MHVQSLDESPVHHRGGQASYLLLAGGQFEARQLAITWVEGAPGSEQALHAHPDNEQIYVIVSGQGLMTCDDEQRAVGARTLVFVPPGTRHAIRNTGSEPLVFISATAPPFANTDAWRPQSVT